jgi:hypothetical protein
MAIFSIGHPTMLLQILGPSSLEPGLQAGLDIFFSLG